MEGPSHTPVFKPHYQNQDSSLQPFDEITKQGKKKMLIFFFKPCKQTNILHSD